ncbi:MAG TPA: oligosaccharide flippase family protein [Thermoanaerobaculia bacterium]|nr:oligosaccharide flippase family protein [Thermoanaerobaculia bacterium]
MSERPAPSNPKDIRKRLLDGGSLVLAADALQGPVAVVLAAYLGRRLGIEGLALYLLAASVVTWFEIATSSLFSRATVQLVGEAHEWRPVASLVLRWHLGSSLAMATILLVVAEPVERMLGVESLGQILRLFALEPPLFALARAYTQVLVGLGRFRARALCSAGRSLARLVIAVVLVEAGMGVQGAVLASIGSAAFELALARFQIRLPLMERPPRGLGRRLLSYSLPLFANGMSLQLFHRLGLLLLVPLGGSLAGAGIYGAAQNLLRVRRILGQSLTPLLLSSLTRLRRDGEVDGAGALARDALSWSLYPTPVIATLAGAASGVMALVFGAEFAEGGPVLAWLLASAPSFLVLSVATAALVSEGRPAVPVKLSVPTVVVAALGMVWAVPRAGAVGAAATTSICAGGCALAALLVLGRGLDIAPRAATVARCAIVSGVAWLAARTAPLEGWWLLIELPAIALAALALLVVLGEQRAAASRALRKLFPRVAAPRG